MRGNSKRRLTLLPQRERAVRVFGGHSDVIFHFENEMRGVAVHSEPERSWFSQIGVAVHNGGWKGRLELVARQAPQQVTFMLYVDHENETRDTTEVIAVEPVLVWPADFRDDPRARIYLYESAQSVSVQANQSIGVIAEVDGTVISPKPVRGLVAEDVIDLRQRKAQV